MSTDRNLLVGILAVQMNFIRNDELILAMNHWVLEKHLSLSAILTKHQILSTTRAALLGAVVDEHLKAHGEDARQCLLTLSHNGSLPAALEQIKDEEVQQSVQDLSIPTKHETGAETVGLEISQPTALSPKPTDTDQRYRILRPHAKGGLSEIFVAEDKEVHQEVVLKEFQKQYAASLTFI
ncbi:MAG: hypothetical protein JNJ77_13425 [Planctomycetia bacterium]|nr:hypothetical protein [Planctomycetia bacterium]